MSTNTDLLEQVKQRQEQLGIRQTTLAGALHISQGHLSKILRNHVNLSKKMENRLLLWINATGDQPKTSDEKLRNVLKRLMRGTPARRIQIMHLLKAIDDLIS